MVLLGLWLCSFLVSLDVLYQLKPFDLVGPVALFVFRKELRAFLKSGLLVARSMKWLWLIAVVSSFLTFLFAKNIIVLAVIPLRLYRFASYLAAFGIVFAARLTPRQRKLLIGVIAFGAIAEAILIVLQYLGVVPSLWPMHERIYSELVPTGTLALNHVNNVLFMLTGSSALLTWSLLSSRTFGWLIGGAGAAVMAAAILFGEARLGLMGIPLLALFLFFALRGRGILVVGAGALVAVVAGGVVLAGAVDTASMVWNRRIAGRVINPGSVESLEQVDPSRFRIWRFAFDGFVKNPIVLLTGVGFQNFKLLVDSHAVAAHNLYLELLGELGMPGLVAFGAMMLGLLRLFRVGRRQGEYLSDVSGIAMALALTLLILGLANETLYPKRPIPGFLGYVMGYWGLATGFAPQKWATSRGRRRLVLRHFRGRV